jgi:hypothetical protein
MDNETQQIPRHHLAAAGAVYLVQAEHSQTGNVVRESHGTMNAAITRAAILLQAGYSIEIWSSLSVGEHCRHASGMDTQKSKVSYSLQARHADGGDDVSESYPTIKAAVARAVELLQRGYTVEIASSPSIETR